MDRERIAVAWSGGRDSTALLHATLVAAQPLGLEVLALHVHHGLSPNADAWLAHCQSQCRRWSRRGFEVRLLVARLQGCPERNESIEAWARKHRYRALRQMAMEQGADTVLLAHHCLDQAETVLIQALRGGGVAGLAGMPRETERDGIHWVRPWLDQEPQAIAAYVRRHRLRHIDDESNADPRFTRNRLRLQVWPALESAFPHAMVALADTAAWAQQATVCLDELAAIDLAEMADVHGLAVARWAGASPARRANALRHWLRAQLGRPAAASLVTRLMEELPHAGQGAWPAEGGWLRIYRGCLSWWPDGASSRSETAREASLCIRRAGRHVLPGWGGVLSVRRVREGGVPLAWLARVDLRGRAGGEQFQAGVGRPPRSLKKQYQAMGVPAWEREGPLLFSGGQLVYVPGLGLDARVIGLPGQALVELSWEGEPPG
ncbi:tRNA lysidine(34) synthetase TilS [uncultured Piscinibacter sp.]|uniref:tRNA lysidine(34) synthetase TilS n=1 Tax=uncultured Piscinibacter sp. TaxID=1131835 RepID=UPI00260C7B74|nr:tRNA lysidine(34) synthetase TilS [uncultured Piscinibacter sp.]